MSRDVVADVLSTITAVRWKDSSVKYSNPPHQTNHPPLLTKRFLSLVKYKLFLKNNDASTSSYSQPRASNKTFSLISKARTIFEK